MMDVVAFSAGNGFFRPARALLAFYVIVFGGEVAIEIVSLDLANEANSGHKHR